MLYEIEQNILGNHSSRGVHKPLIIVNHITAGSFQSVINTFNNLANDVSSTFLNGRDGRIRQFVDLKNRPKTNGFIRNPSSPIVKQIGPLNPNYYSISIENEGYAGNGIDGDITEAQFYSLCWLHKWIQTEVIRVFNVRIPLNSTQVIGHFQIDSVQKASCPGPKFPWGRLYTELAIADSMDFDHYEERLNNLQGDGAKRSTAYAIAERIQDLGNKLDDPKWGNNAATKLSWLYPVMDVVTGEQTPRGVVSRVLAIYKTAMGSGQYSPEGVRKLLLFEPIMREKGLLP